MLGCMSQPQMQTAQEENTPMSIVKTPKAQKELEDRLILKKEFLNVRRNSRKKSHTPNN